MSLPWPDLLGSAQPLTSKYNVRNGSSEMPLIDLRKCLLPSLLNVLIMKWCWTFSNVFSVSIEMIM